MIKLIFSLLLPCIWVLCNADMGGCATLEHAISTTAVDLGPVEGFMGIPGARDPSSFLAIIWGMWVGWIFSTIGAFGGIMAGVGHISVFGLGNYATLFQNTNPALSKSLTDCVRVSNQCLVGFSALISSLYYYRMDRLVLPVGIFLASGGILASVAIPILTVGKIDPNSYIGYFGLSVLIMGSFLYYETSGGAVQRNSQAKAAAEAFETDHINRMRANIKQGHEVKIVSIGFNKVTFTFYGVEFSFNPILAFMGGAFIAAFSTFIGIGGGFLYVPFLTQIIGLPLFIVAGTSAIAVLISMISAIISYIGIMGVSIDIHFIFMQNLGILIGSIIGPWISRFTPEVWIARIFIALSTYVGLGYSLRGFIGHSILPGM